MKKKHNAVKTVLGIVLAVLIIAGLGYFAYVFFQVEEIEIVGNGKFTASYIEALANIQPETHMLQVDEEQIEQNIESAEPYLEVLSITKKIPKTVKIEVSERQPKALIAYANTYLLTDLEANVLETLNERPPEPYPVIVGIAVSGVNLGSQITTEDNFKITVMGELLTELESRDLFSLIDTIDLSNVNNIKITSTDGLTIKFGQADKIAEKVKWIKNRLPALEKEGKNTGILDVSSGSFATYTMFETGETAPAAADPAAGDDQQAPENTGEGTGNDPEEGTDPAPTQETTEP